MTTSPVGTSTPTKTPVVNAADTSTSYQKLQKRVGDVKDTIASAAENASEWRAVKTVRGSTVWYYITWPVSAFFSFVGSIWARISKAVVGSPIAVQSEIKDVKVSFPRLFREPEVKKIPAETAIRNGWLTIQEVIAQQETGFTMEQAIIKGWGQVDIPGRVWGSSKMMLKDAVERGYMTGTEAIKAEHITEEQAKQATWLKLVTSTETK